MKSIQLNPDGTLPVKVDRAEAGKDYTATYTMASSTYQEERPEPKKDWRKVIKEAMQFGVILWCISTGFGAAVALVIRLVRFIISL